ncbi:MAG: hypothetical protein U1E65_16830 [Myxococcota bacterium]
MKHYASLVLLMSGLPMGCMTAHAAPKIHFDGNWAEDPAKDRQMREMLSKAETRVLKAEDTEGVDVFIGKIPSGLKLEQGILSADEGSGLQILGKAVFEASTGTQFGFPDYEQGWRKGMCYWQAPLTWVTLAIWSIIPLNYPCGVDNMRSKEDVLRATKGLVKELGGDFFVGEYTYATQDEAAGVVGFVVKKAENTPVTPSTKTDI